MREVFQEMRVAEYKELTVIMSWSERDASQLAKVASRNATLGAEDLN